MNSLDDVDFEGRRVFTRVDFNVPLSDEGAVEDDLRIRAALPTLKRIVEGGGRCIVASHLGRPNGAVVEDLSLFSVQSVLSGLMEGDVWFAPDCVGPEVKEIVGRMPAGGTVVLENLRFHSGETENDAEFARELAGLADCFVNDAFGAAHRAHASTVGVGRHFDLRVPGYLMQREVASLGRITNNPKKPFVLMVGGKKAKGKMEVIRNLLDNLDILLIGGAMAFTFLAARGDRVGRSIVDEDRLSLASDILEEVSLREIRLELPHDLVAVEPPADGQAGGVAAVSEFPRGMIAVDIGPETRERFADAMKGSGTVVWNGPMGIAEKPEYAEGTVAMARTLAELTSAGTETVIGGGDVTAAVRKSGYGDRVSHLSTGGGATLEFLAGKELPAIAVLNES